MKDQFVYGVHPTLEVLESGKEIEKILIKRASKDDNLKKIIRIAKDRNIPFTEVPDEKFLKFTRKNHQGVLCFISLVQYSSIENVIQDAFNKAEDPFIIALDRVTDVRNLGAIARTAECMGAHALLVPAKGAAMINADAVKSSSGAITRIPICRAKSLGKGLAELQESGLRIIACTEKATENAFDADMAGPVVILLGSEEDGITPFFIDKADLHVKIPMKGRTASLNVANASAMLMYEVSRQRIQ